MSALRSKSTRQLTLPSTTVGLHSCNVDMCLSCQLPMSPLLNVLHLRIFHAIQARQRCVPTRTVDELVAAVTDSYWQLPVSTINAVFLSLQCSIYQFIDARGSNDNHPRNLSKSKLLAWGKNSAERALLRSYSSFSARVDINIKYCLFIKQTILYTNSQICTTHSETSQRVEPPLILKRSSTTPF